MSTVLIPRVPRTGPSDADGAASQPPAPQPPVQRPDEPGTTARNRLAVVAAVVGVLAVLLAAFSTLTWVVAGLAVLGSVLGLAAILRARHVRTGLVPSVLAVVLSLGSLGLVTVFSGFTDALASHDSSASSITSDKLEITFGSITRNSENGTSLVEVTVRNTSGDPVSSWASLAAMKGTKTVAAQGVGVKDLQPGAEVTQTVVFNEELPKKVTFEVRAVL